MPKRGGNPLSVSVVTGAMMCYDDGASPQLTGTTRPVRLGGACVAAYIQREFAVCGGEPLGFPVDCCGR